ncbi:MAG: hypothetical protein KatS3mg034_1964 [Vicingaceae bacterium]|nr:MAG: hypothetical protein KatS3mg034_1964 [Vicingaceae bacterium]
MASIDELKLICNQVRRDILRMVHGAASGHPGGSLGCVEYFVALYFEIMKHDPESFYYGREETKMFFFSPTDTFLPFGTVFWPVADILT